MPVSIIQTASWSVSHQMESFCSSPLVCHRSLVLMSILYGMTDRPSMAVSLASQRPNNTRQPQGYLCRVLGMGQL
jgi:hypothetical protein